MTSSQTQPNQHIRTDAEKRVIAFAHWVIRWRWPVVILCLAMALAAGSGGRFLGFSTDYRVFFSEKNPQLNAFEALQDTYTKDDNMLLVLQPAKGDVFTAEFLTAVRELTQASWKIPYTTRVDSITNFQHSFAEGDDLTVRDLVSKSLSLTPEAISHIREVALGEPLMVNRLIAPDAKTTGINLTLTRPELSESETPEAMAAVRKMVEEFRAGHPDIKIALSGVVALNNAFSEASQKDMGSLIPLMYGILILAMIVILRSVSGTITTVAIIAMSAITAMGLAGWLGVSITAPSATAPTIIMTLAVADSIHLLITLFHEMRHGAGKRDAIVESLRVNFQPVFLTSLTTAIGFLSLNFSDAPPFRDLGNMAAAGVAAAWLYSIFFLPALMAILPARVKARPLGYTATMDRLAEFVIAKRRVLLWSMSALVLGLAVMVPRIELNDQFVNYFDHSIEFRRDTDFAMENLSGIYQMEFSLPAAETGGISNPDYLAQISGFSDWLRVQPGVVHVITLSDIMDRLNKNMHGDKQDWYRLPEERNLAAQYLLLFEMSLPYGLDLNNQINVDKSSLRITATLENISTAEARVLKRNAETWLSKNMQSAATAEPTGPFVMFAYISERNIKSMLLGTTIALVLISLSMILALRHFKLGLLSLIPNLIPALMAFGVWSIFIGEMGLAASIVTATSLGIIVDDTVHFLSKYQRARREKMASPEDAVRYAFSTVGIALWATSLILIAGFAVLSLSTFRMNATLGELTALAVFAALAADFLLLPPLLIALDNKEKNYANDAEAVSVPAE